MDPGERDPEGSEAKGKGLSPMKPEPLNPATYNPIIK
jgi:hypothetical protein